MVKPQKDNVSIYLDNLENKNDMTAEKDHIDHQFAEALGLDFEELLHGVEDNFHDQVGTDITSTLTKDTSLAEIRLMVESRLPEDMDFWITLVQELGSPNFEAVVYLGPCVGHRGQEFEQSPTRRVADARTIAYSVIHGHRGDECVNLMEVPGWMAGAMGPLHGDQEDLMERAIEIAKLALVEDPEDIKHYQENTYD